MRGAPGTSIKLTIVRPGREQSFDVGITREIIELKPVRWEVKDGIGVINIVSFSADTGADVQAAIRGIEKSLGHKPLGYILDLRSNRSEEHTSELQSLMRISYAVFCLKKKNTQKNIQKN